MGTCNTPVHMSARREPVHMRQRLLLGFVTTECVRTVVERRRVSVRFQTNKYSTQHRTSWSSHKALIVPGGGSAQSDQRRASASQHLFLPSATLLKSCASTFSVVKQIHEEVTVVGALDCCHDVPLFQLGRDCRLTWSFGLASAVLHHKLPAPGQVHGEQLARASHDKARLVFDAEASLRPATVHLCHCRLCAREHLLRGSGPRSGRCHPRSPCGV